MPPKELSEKQVKKSLNAAIWDGSFWAAMVGFGESFFSAFAVFLKATNFELGVLGSLPQLLGALCQLATTKLITLFGSRKRLVLAGVVLQALTLVPIALIFLAPQFNVLLLIGFVCLYYVFGQIVSPAWSSWIGDLVDEEQRGKYFGKRNKIIGIVTFLGLLIGGVALHYMKTGPYADEAYLSFTALFLLAFVARLLSFLALLRQDEPIGPIAYRSRSGFIAFLKSASRTNYGLLVFYLSAMNFAVYIAAPYFTAYMLNDLQMDYVTFTILTAASVIVKYLMMPFWGKAADKYGTRRVLALSSVLVPIVPILWLFSSNFWYLMLAQFVSGFVWAGFEIASFNFLLDATEPERRSSMFAYYNVLNGIAMFLGAMLGVLLIKYPLLLNGYMVVFLISGLARYGVVFLFLPKLREVREVKKISYRELLFQVVASTQTMGFVHKVIIPEMKPVLKQLDPQPLLREVDALLEPLPESVHDAMKLSVTGTKLIISTGLYPVEQMLKEPAPVKPKKKRKARNKRKRANNRRSS